MVPQQQRRRRRRAVLPRTSERRVIVARGPGGFGFTIAGQRPCVVSAVAGGGPAERAGLRAGDALLAVDGASVARASHASVARLVAAAPGAIALSVAPREAPPTDTEDTEPDERARTRRRHPPPRRRPTPMMHHPSCHAAPSTSGVNEILQNLSRAQLTPSHAARLECRAVVGYLGTIETPQAAATAAPGDVRSAVRKLRQERRPATPVLLSVLPNVLLLRRPTAQVLAQYARERIVYAGCSDADRRYFGLVTAAEMPEAETSHSCHVFAVDPRMAEHEAHATRAREFQIACTRDPVAERCLEFPPSAEYVVGVIRGMYSLPPDDSGSPTLQQLSKLALKGDSPAMGNFSRCNRAVFRVPRDRRPCRHEDARIDGAEFVANSPQPSNHSEITTTSSNSDSGIGFHNDCRNIADRILVVDFAGQQPPPNRFRQEMPRRPMGLVGCSSFDADGSFLSNTTPVVDGFGGQGRPLNLDDVILNSNDLQPVRHVSPRNDDDNYNYNNVYGNLPSTSRCNGAVYDQVYTENESHYELPPPQLDLELDRVVETFNSVEIYEERPRQADCQSNESVENVTVISGGTSKASMDSVSVYSSRSHEEARPARRRHLQASLDDMLVLGLRDPPPPTHNNDDANFVHPASIKCKVRKSIKPLNILSRTRHMLSKDREKKDMRRAISASAGDVTGGGGGGEQDPLPAAASEPDLRDTQSEQSSPFRRWTTGSGAGSSYRHTDHRNLYTKQMSEGSSIEPSSSGTSSPRGKWPNGGVARWALGLEQLLADPVGAAAFAAFLAKEFAHENIAFWYSCEAYSKVHDPVQRARLAKDIWDRHLAEGAVEPVNIDATARRAAVARLNLDPPPLDLFSQPMAVEMEEGESEVMQMQIIDQDALEWVSIQPLVIETQMAKKKAREKEKEKKELTEEEKRRQEEIEWEIAREVELELELAMPRGSKKTILKPTSLGLIPVEVTHRPPREPIPLTPYQKRKMKDQAQRHVFNIMKLDSYPRFLRSAVHAECARADLRGQPPPYGPSTSGLSSASHASPGPHASTSDASPDPSILSDFTPQSTPTKLKKSASNVSERRRSGGASLLPWKLRVSSRDRSGAGSNVGGGGPAAAAGAGTGAALHPAPPPLAAQVALPPGPTDGGAPTDAGLHQPPITDVVKSGALCRVVLPDGATTSVVGVEAAVTVRKLIDRLLQRRNLLAVNYDVLLKDCQPGETAVIDSSAPSTVLGGREVVVERRCVVRMEVCGRCVAVRCRPARRLRHVLRPVLARYAPPSTAPRAVLRDGTPVHPDTAMQELDGCRLVIVEVSEGEECRERARDDDADSLSDVAVRVHDDHTSDQQSNPGSRSGREARDGPATAAGRVRAALRAGPPLHHHPPDFLENLRETQRKLLQNKNEPSPAPRTPPPLPPKPATRAPTLV